MKTEFYLNGKKTTQKSVKELLGEKRYEKILRDAKETWEEDPLIANDFYIGGGKMLTVEFC